MDGDEKALHFIVDPSALVYGGIGRIRQWFKDDKYHNRRAVYFVPRYTLLELDFLKKAFNSLIAMNARESVRFIDESISNYDDEGDGLEGLDDFESYNESKERREGDSDGADGGDSDGADVRDSDESDGGDSDDLDESSLYSRNMSSAYPPDVSSAYPPHASGLPQPSDLAPPSSLTHHSAPPYPPTFVLEDAESAGPEWKAASGYRKRTPLKSEFPSARSSERGAVGVFGSKLLGPFNGKEGIYGRTLVNSATIKETEIKNRKEVEDNEGDEKAIVPKRLKLLIRSSIQKVFIENRDRQRRIRWLVLCEDETTRIWLKCFDIEVKTLNEADTMLRGERAGVSDERRRGRSRGVSGEAKKAGQEKSLEKPSTRSPRSRDSRSEKYHPPHKRTTRRLCEDGVYRENFKEMKYAPRGQGELWSP
ncbi:DEKNAAC101416 [Brettanomyces naardenensis]|uniref:DEKNAAC101416 n=1 Tax=Brettanomyces naardenensis TaxID=13370 RepID=A0A448YI74_BRENA|nr:DEKNAAC101416 [Brettanomyces naardenensis]